MKSVKGLHVALYGNVPIKRGFCPECGDTAFIKHGRFVCCGLMVNQDANKIKRVCEPEQRRHIPKKGEREEILQRQQFSCLYCGYQFGSIRHRGYKTIVLRLEWDHRIPYAYTQDNRAVNYVAACHVCNGLKSAQIFQTVDEAQIFLMHHRKEKGYDF